MKEYETFEHEADVGVRGFGRTMEEAFQNGAKALFSVMVELDKVDPKKKVEINCEAPDSETLFVEWLNELLSTSDIKDIVFSEFEVKIDENKLSGFAYGEELDQEKHRPKIEVKAATYSQMKVYQEEDTWITQCIVDI